MYSLSIITSFLSVWCLFAATEKVEYEKKGITLMLSGHIKVAVFAALVWFLISTVLLGLLLGGATGILASMVVWMIWASVVLLLAPFSKLKSIHILLIVLLMVGMELLSPLVF